MSRAIIGVDVDVAVGQITGPDLGFACADAKIDADHQFLLLHVGAGRILGIARRAPAIFGHDDIAKPDRQAISVGCGAGFANGHDDPAPVGVFTGDGCFHQGRVGDGEAYCLGVGIVGRAADLNLDKFGSPFPVADHQQREIERMREAQFPMFIARTVEEIEEIVELVRKGLATPDCMG